ncbi:hypothetical protein QAD02_013380 [Eretmocerus hayati]|uniref:Uncharacterized protein n=1 Tax=Eretmocerus hayati TaxID=131215 RepID=A0ACC2P3B0_9HYME|nr:hypothetical protein QAD02_013380 [Eretmocerus hayati]
MIARRIDTCGVEAFGLVPQTRSPAPGRLPGANRRKARSGFSSSILNDPESLLQRCDGRSWFYGIHRVLTKIYQTTTEAECCRILSLGLSRLCAVKVYVLKSTITRQQLCGENLVVENRELQEHSTRMMQQAKATSDENEVLRRQMEDLQKEHEEMQEQLAKRTKSRQNSVNMQNSQSIGTTLGSSISNVPFHLTRRVYEVHQPKTKEKLDFALLKTKIEVKLGYSSGLHGCAKPNLKMSVKCFYCRSNVSGETIYCVNYENCFRAYHPSCAGRATLKEDGSYKKCCGADISDPEEDNQQTEGASQNSLNNSYNEDFSDAEEMSMRDLLKQMKSLLGKTTANINKNVDEKTKSISQQIAGAVSRIGDLEADVKGVKNEIANINTRVAKVEELYTRDQYLVSEQVISEAKERLNRDRNVILFESSVESFYRIIKENVELHVPVTELRDRNFPEWYSKDLIDLIFDKNRAHTEWKKTNKLEDYVEFKRLRALVIRTSRTT